MRNGLIGTLLVTLSLVVLHAAPEGFYKDIFMDGGVDLTSRITLPAANSGNMSLEYLATESQALQDWLIIGNEDDANGVLLYPDNAPRFRCIYTNGGSATGHGNSMGNDGRTRVRTFYTHGGSFTGSCAGAYIASLSYLETGVYTPYYHIWPGRTAQLSIASVYTGHDIMENSPLLDYFSFGGDHYIANVYHNYGPYARENLDFPTGTEILMRYDHPASGLDGRVSCWAYKSADFTGRVVVIGSHPESIESGERLQLMIAILRYAMDGTGGPELKADLVNGIPRIMDKGTDDMDPDNARVGDRQLHHFRVEIPPGTGHLTLDLEGIGGFDLGLYAQADSFAFGSQAPYSSVQPGAQQQLVVPEPEAGEWYIGVECLSTVETTRRSWGYEYTAGTEVLNGVAYTITANWDPVRVVDQPGPVSPMLLKNFPNPFNDQTRIEFKVQKPGPIRLEIFDVAGHRVQSLLNEELDAGRHNVSWQPRSLNAGVYLARLTYAEGAVTLRLIYLK